MTWKILELGASPIEFIDGDRSSNYPKRSELVEDGIPFFSTQNIANNRFNYRDVAFITEEKLATLRKGKLIDEDIVITTRGTLGNAAIFSAGEFETAFINAQMLILRVADKNQLNYRFLYYWIISNETQVKFRNHASGTAQPQLPIRDLKRVTISIPPIEEQKRIADILSAYDDLIDNNNRRIALLEEAIHRLYREWFVHLRFPGHEHTPVVDGVPEGWEKRQLQDVLILQRGFDLPTRKREPGEIPVYASTGIAGYHNKAKVKGPGVVTGRSGSLGTVMYIYNDYWPLNTSLWVREFKGIPPEFAYLLLEELHLEKFNSGGAVPTLNRNHVHTLPVIKPPKSLLERFEEIIKPFFAQIKTLTDQNKILAEARDALLPRLMNGSLPV